VEYEGFSWTAAARKHRVSRAQVSYVVVMPVCTSSGPPLRRTKPERYAFLVVAEE